MAERPQDTARCKNCGHVRREHSYNGACYGLCGEFVQDTAQAATPTPAQGEGLRERASEWIDDLIRHGTLSEGDRDATVYAITEFAIKETNRRASLSPVTIADFVRAQAAWSEVAFGPGERTAGNIDHIRKELAEVEQNPTDVTEWCDVATLALDGAWRVGHSPEAIAAAIVAKLEKNKARRWPDWRTHDKTKGVEHIRDEASPVDPRDPDPSRPGVFRDHNCARCHSGKEPCVTGNPNQCEYPHARND